MSGTQAPANGGKQAPELDSFEALIAQACAEPEPAKLLIVLVRVEPVHYSQADGSSRPAEGEGTLIPTMVKDLPVTPELTLADVVETADAARRPWDFMMLAVFPGRDGRAPSTEECDPHLKRMAKALFTGGDLSRFAIFNRDGEPVFIENPLL